MPLPWTSRRHSAGTRRCTPRPGRSWTTHMDGSPGAGSARRGTCRAPTSVLRRRNASNVPRKVISSATSSGWPTAGSTAQRVCAPPVYEFTSTRRPSLVQRPPPSTCSKAVSYFTLAPESARATTRCERPGSPGIRSVQARSVPSGEGSPQGGRQTLTSGRGPLPSTGKARAPKLALTHTSSPAGDQARAEGASSIGSGEK